MAAIQARRKAPHKNLAADSSIRSTRTFRFQRRSRELLALRARVTRLMGACVSRASDQERTLVRGEVSAAVRVNRELR